MKTFKATIFKLVGDPFVAKQTREEKDATFDARTMNDAKRLVKDLLKGRYRGYELGKIEEV